MGRSAMSYVPGWFTANQSMLTRTCSKKKKKLKKKIFKKKIKEELLAAMLRCTVIRTPVDLGGLAIAG